MKKAIRSLTTTPCRGIIETKDMKIPEKATIATFSGITATVFGNSSLLGAGLSTKLWLMGARCIHPYRSTESKIYGQHHERHMNLNPGNNAFLHISDFTDEKELMLAMRNQNVVINCIGNRFYYNKDYDYELANIHIPRMIAKCVKQTPSVKRFIHVSAAGIDPQSPSIMLRTKWFGEQAVKEIYPDVTIIRPTLLYSVVNSESSFVGRWLASIRLTAGTGIIIGKGEAQVQPVYYADVAEAMINCLKLQETIGQTYELGGPVVYTYKELYEFLFNAVNMKPYMVSIPVDTAFDFYNSPPFTSYIRLYMHQYLNQEQIMAETVDRVCNLKVKGFADVCVKPVAFAQMLPEVVRETYFWANRDLSKRIKQYTV